jgi:curved DNA-binding protein CbpA
MQTVATQAKGWLSVAEKSLYDILEVSPNASAEAIRAAYERLSAKYDAFGNDGQFSAEARIRHDAVKEAFLTLGSPEKRTRYNRERLAKLHIEPPVPPAPASNWSGTALVAVLLILAGGGWYYHDHKQTEKRIAAERALVEARAREAAEQARLIAEQRRAEADRVRLEMQQQRMQQQAEERVRREHEMTLRRHNTEQRMQSQASEYAARRDTQEQRRAEEQRRREEQQAATVARNQAAREKAELCRIERERYGRALSC